MGCSSNTKLFQHKIIVFCKSFVNKAFQSVIYLVKMFTKFYCHEVIVVLHGDFLKKKIKKVPANYFKKK